MQRGLGVFVLKVLQFVFMVTFSVQALSQDNFVLQNFNDRPLAFGSTCYSYAEGAESSASTFKCRRVADSMYVDGLIESVMFDEIVLWGEPSGYSFLGQEPLKKIYLNSKGGLMFDHSGVASSAVDIIRLIKEKEIETYARAECKSACVPIFVSGLKRVANKNSSFMVHSPRLGAAHLLFLKDKCGDLLGNPECTNELEEIKAQQLLDMELYFSLLEREGVSFNLRNDYLLGDKNESPYLNGNFIGYKDLYFDGVQALGYGVALSLIK